MRRSALATAAVALVLAVCGGCDQDQETVDLPSLRIKLGALTADTCHTDPRAQTPQSCRKYVTQLAGTARTVVAAGASTRASLTDPGRRMTQAVRAYLDAKCERERPKEEQACHPALESLAQAVEDARNELEE